MPVGRIAVVRLDQDLKIAEIGSCTGRHLNLKTPEGRSIHRYMRN